MTLNFIDAQRVGSQFEDALEVIFFFTIDESEERYQIHMGRPGYFMAPEEKVAEGTQELFGAAIYVINKIWNARGELPDPKLQFFERDAFQVVALKKTDWQDYKLTLKDKE